MRSISETGHLSKKETFGERCGDFYEAFLVSEIVFSKDGCDAEDGDD